MVEFEAAALAIRYWLTQQGRIISAARRCCSLLVEVLGPNIRQAVLVHVCLPMYLPFPQGQGGLNMTSGLSALASACHVALPEAASCDTIHDGQRMHSICVSRWQHQQRQRLHVCRVSGLSLDNGAAMEPLTPSVPLFNMAHQTLNPKYSCQCSPHVPPGEAVSGPEGGYGISCRRCHVPVSLIIPAASWLPYPLQGCVPPRCIDVGRPMLTTEGMHFASCCTRCSATPAALSVSQPV